MALLDVADASPRGQISMELGLSVSACGTSSTCADHSESPRSTSAGSDSSARNRDQKFDAMDAELACCEKDVDEGPAARLSASSVGLPEHLIASNMSLGHLIVKNTFFDTPTVRPESLDDFYKERQVSSCPATRNPTADTERLSKCVQEMAGADALEMGRGPEALETPSSRDWNSIPKLAKLRTAISCIVQNTFLHAPIDRNQTIDECGLLVEDDGRRESEPSREISWSATPEPASVAISIADALKAEEEDLSRRVVSSIDSGASLPPWLAFPLAATGFDPRLDPSMLVIDSNDEVFSAQSWFAASSSFGLRPPPPADRAPGAFNFDADFLLPMPAENADVALAGLGSSEMPSIGSVLHASGRCKPCSFVHKAEGCQKDHECPFCHLCDGREKKRREKAKREQFRAAAAAGEF